MSTYDPFRFMEERQEGKQVTEADCNEFQMFNTCRYLSMSPNMRKYVHILNDLQFQNSSYTCSAETIISSMNFL